MKFLTVSAALMLSLGLSQATLAQGQGKGNDGERGKGKGEERQDRGQRDDRDRGKGNSDGDRKGGERDRGPEQRVEREQDRGRGRGEGRDRDRDERVVVVTPEPDRGRERDRVVVVRPDRDRDRDRTVVVRRDFDPYWNRDWNRDWDRDVRVVVVNPYGGRRLIRGCPPGLAKKNNGCLPPGQARKLERARHDWLWDRRYDDQRYRYDDGYLYRYDRQGGLLGYLPTLGGALSVGSLWPAQYSYDPTPAYYTDYYGLDDPYDYRYADGAIYGVNRQTNAIQQVSALLTGQSLAVGQQMPAGYDIYNVPYAQRGQYFDTADSAYRYNDGAIYQVDPKTQVIQAIIQLLTR